MGGCLAVYNFWIFNKHRHGSENTDMGLSVTRQLKLVERGVDEAGVTIDRPASSIKASRIVSSCRIGEARVRVHRSG